MPDNSVVVDNHDSDGLAHTDTSDRAGVMGMVRGRLASMRVPVVVLVTENVPASASTRSRMLVRPEPLLAELRLRKPCPLSWIIQERCSVVHASCTSTVSASLWRATLASASWIERNRTSSLSHGGVSLFLLLMVS